MNLRAIAIVSALAAALAAGQDSRDPQVRGKQIVDEAVAALGGDLFLNMQNRVETGRAYSFYQDRLSGLSAAVFYTRYTPVDADKTATELGLQEHESFGKDGEEDYYAVIRQEGGWEVTYRGPKPLEPETITRHRETALHNIFYILQMRFHEPGMLFEYQGGDVIDNMPVNIVDVVDSQNNVVTVYFHQTTKLPVRQDWVWHDPKTHERNEEITRFGRYREEDGVQWPLQLSRTRNGDKIYEAFFSSVAFDQDLDPELFAIPTEDSRPEKR